MNFMSSCATFFMNFMSHYQQCKFVMEQYCKHDSFSSKAVTTRFGDLNYNQQADVLNKIWDLEMDVKDQIIELADFNIKNKPFTDCSDPKDDKRVAEAKKLTEEIKRIQKLHAKMNDIHEETKKKTKLNNIEDLKSIKKFEAMNDLLMMGLDVTTKPFKNDADNQAQPDMTIPESVSSSLPESLTTEPVRSSPGMKI